MFSMRVAPESLAISLRSWVSTSRPWMTRVGPDAIAELGPGRVEQNLARDCTSLDQAVGFGGLGKGKYLGDDRRPDTPVLRLLQRPLDIGKVAKRIADEPEPFQ